MSTPSSHPSWSDRNLLFGIMALQMDFITRDQLVAAMHAWVANKKTTLGALLVEQKALSAERHLLLEALVKEHLKQHHDDPHESLQALSSVSSVRKPLEAIDDADVQASLGHVSITPKESEDPFATRPITQADDDATGIRFRILRLHARGGLGEVLVARDKELGREVALKQIQERFAHDPTSRSRFVLEAEVTGGLEHPGVVPVYGLGQYADGRPFYAMRFVKGDSLKEAIERFHRPDRAASGPGSRNLELRQLLGRFVDVCQAIAYAHHRGVLHRDLKPGNVMLGHYGETLVVDWGLAKVLGKNEIGVNPQTGSFTAPLIPASYHDTDATEMGSTVGTPAYMSPEQAAGMHHLIGPATDIYSLGATLYCLLTGRPPFVGKDLPAMLRQVERGDFPRPRHINPDIPKPLEAICLKAMMLAPHDRYETAHLLAEDVEHWLADEPTLAWREPFAVRASRWLRRHRTIGYSIASAAAAALVILAVGNAVLTAANERERLAKEEALAQRAQAESNFKLARQAVDRYHTEVSEEMLLREPGLEPLRKKLLEAAREFYDRFVQQRGDDPQLKGESGRALFRLAQISGDLDGAASGIPLLDKALAVFASLGSEFQVDLARTYQHLGYLNRLIDNHDQAERAYGEARERWSLVIKNEPKYQVDLARTHLGLGNVRRALRRFEAACADYEKALRMLSELVRQEPDEHNLRRHLAVAHSNLANAVLSLGGDKKKAREAATAAVKIQEELVRDRPQISQYRDDLARSWLVLGVAEVGDDPEQARAAFEKAVSHWETLTARHPDVLDFRSRLAQGYRALAGVSQGRAALDLCEKALRLQHELADKHAGVPQFRRDLALEHKQLGVMCRLSGYYERAGTAFRAALAILEPLAAAPDAPPQYQADLASVHQQLAELHLTRNRLEEAGAAASTSIKLLHEVHQRDREAAPFKHELALGYALRARIYNQRTRYAEALKDLDHAIPLAAPRDRLVYMFLRSEARVRSGDAGKALEEAEGLAASMKSSGEAQYCLARLYSVASTLEGSEPIAAEHKRRAFDLLKRAESLAYFRDRANRQRLESDPELQSVRERDDFLAWFRNLGGTPESNPQQH